MYIRHSVKKFGESFSIRSFASTVIRYLSMRTHFRRYDPSGYQVKSRPVWTQKKIVRWWIIFGICVPIGLIGQNDVFFAQKCIRLVHEKLTVFPYAQDIVGIYVSLVFRTYSQVGGRCLRLCEICKNVTLISGADHPIVHIAAGHAAGFNS